MSQVSFKINSQDFRLVERIVDRAAKYAAARELALDRLELSMDITAVHANGCPLDLDKFLRFDDVNFAHDLFGIRRHIDRRTGQLTGCFVPRCARPEARP